VGAVSLMPAPQHSARLLVAQADQALYRAKHEGCNRACVAGVADAITAEGELLQIDTGLVKLRYCHCSFTAGWRVQA